MRWRLLSGFSLMHTIAIMNANVIMNDNASVVQQQYCCSVFVLRMVSSTEEPSERREHHDLWVLCGVVWCGAVGASERETPAFFACHLS